MAKLILTRHGQSLWNAENRFTGWVNVPLSEMGRAEATIASCKLRDYRVRVCFTSMLFRAIETAVIILTEVDEICDGRIPVLREINETDAPGWNEYQGDPEQELPVYTTSFLDERFYGDLQGLNKAETVEKFGKDQVQQWRRSYDVAPPGGGESLEDTVERTVPFFRDRIMNHLIAGENVLIAAHGNSLRSIVKQLENLSPEEIVKVELGTAIPIVYDIDSQGQVTDKVILN